MPSREEILAQAAGETPEGEVERVAPPDLRNLRNRLLVLAEDVEGKDLQGRNFAELADHAAAVEAYCRAAVHVAGLEAIDAGQRAGVEAASGGFSREAIAGAVWQVVSEGNLEEIGGEAIVRKVLERLEGGGL